MRKFLLISLAFLAGCTTVDNTAVMKDPMPTGTDAKVVAAIKKVAKDPFTVREVKVGPPHRAVNNMSYPNGWEVCTTFYAKNSFGAYNQGFYSVFFKSNQAVDILGGPGGTVYPECGPLHPVAYKY